jgi:tetratricopeptide (TPR) repeat protein
MNRRGLVLLVVLGISVTASGSARPADLAARGVPAAQIHHALDEAAQLFADYPARSLALATSALEQAEAFGDRELQARALLEVCRSYGALGAYAKAIAAGERILRMVGAGGAALDPLLRVGALNHIGFSLYRTGRFAEASDRLAAAIAEAERLHGRAELVTGLTTLGLMERRLGRNESAVEHLLRAGRVAEEAGDRRGWNRALLALGNVYQDRRDFAGAQAAYARALELARATNDRRRAAMILSNIGLLHLQLNELDQALQRLNEATAIWKDLDEQVYYAESLMNLGMVHLRQGEPRLALQDLTDALAIKQRLGEALSVAAIENRLAGVYRRLGRYGAATSANAQAAQVARQLDARPLLRDVEAETSAIAEATGDYRAALAATRRSVAIDNELTNEATSERIAELSAIDTRAREEREIALLKKNEAIASLEAARSGAERNFLLALSALLVLTVGVAAVAYRVKARAAREAAEQRQATEQALSALQESHAKLAEAMAQVKTLGGLLPICSHCKKVRDDDGYWHQVEAYVTRHSDATFTHGVCPACMLEHYGEFANEVAAPDPVKP